MADPTPAPPGTPISTSAPREAPVKSPSVLGSGTEGLCSLQPGGQRVIINRGPSPASNRSSAPATSPRAEPGSRLRSGIGRREKPPTLVSLPWAHPAADPNPIPAGKRRHGAHRQPSEARHGPSAGLGICWRHNEHLCASKRLRTGEPLGEPPLAAGSAHPGSPSLPTGRFRGTPRGRDGVGWDGTPGKRIPDTDCGEGRGGSARLREEEEPPWPVSQGRAGGRCRNSRLPRPRRGQVTGGERGRTGGDFSSDPAGNRQNPDAFKSWADKRDREGSGPGGCAPYRAGGQRPGPEAAVGPGGPRLRPAPPGQPRGAPPAPARGRMEARDGSGARPTPAERPGRGPGAEGANGNHPAAPAGRPLPERGGPARPRPHSPAAAAGALTEPPPPGALTEPPLAPLRPARAPRQAAAAVTSPRTRE
ncbi:translation initiation factor IF-2-like [Molothrus ater]|uniref:translation initiation factor IF-2-like n=1 Tax=Molothrus ater TaxID=84834 RepID=UPI0023E8851A|nr:translation initiation factor IF-2-like [Molothrus ater]